MDKVLGDCGLPGESLLPDPLPAGVTLYALPRGLDDRPLPFALGLCLGLCLGVPALEDILLEWAVRPLDVFEKIEAPFEDLDLEVFRR